MANVVVALHTDCFCVLPCARVSSLYSCIHPRLFLHEMVRARVRRVSEVQAGGCRWTKPISCSSSARGRGSAVHLQGRPTLLLFTARAGPVGRGRSVHSTTHGMERSSCISRARLMYIHWHGEISAMVHTYMYVCVLHIYGSATTETKMAYWPRACCRIGTLWRGVVVGARIPAFKGEILLFFSRRVERGRDGLASHQACITGKAEVVFMAV